MIDLHDLTKYVPYLGLMMSDQRGRPYITRLIEQSLPGIMVAVVGFYVSDAKQSEQIAAVKNELAQVRQELIEMRRDLYVPKAAVK
jgi:hypothetical protein